MSAPNQTLLSRAAIAFSVFTLVMLAVVAARGGDGESAVTSAPGKASLALSEFALTPSAVTVPKGGVVEVSNNGTQVHNVVVEGEGIRVDDLNGGEKGTLDTSSLEPGTYTLLCEISGHKESGMTGTLIVTDGSAGAADQAATEAADAAGDHAGHEVSDMVPGSAEAEAMNKRMEEAMTKSVTDFLATAEEYAAGNIDKGNQKIEPEILPDGTKRFELTAAITDWEVEEGNVVKAWTYNGTVPGPWLRVEPGDKVEVELTNGLPISTDIHWHGVSVPFEMDGVAPITQDYIKPGTNFTYSFTAPDRPELGMYHAHMHGQEAIVNGLFAVFQVGDVPLPAGQTIGDFDIPADVQIDQEIPIVLNDAGVIGLSLNGKSFPATEPIVAQKGDWILMHFYNEGLAGHPMHLHRQPQLVVAKDGFPLTAPYQADTIWVAPGERYSVLVHATEVGTWAFHCHIVSHAESDDGLFGMVTAMIVQDPSAPAEG